MFQLLRFIQEKKQELCLSIYLTILLFIKKKKTFEDFNLFTLLYIMLNIKILFMHYKLLL